MGKNQKIPEINYIIKMLAPILDIVFADVAKKICLYWGEMVSKATSAGCSNDVELSHSECARASTPSKAVRDGSKCLHSNQCVLNKYLKKNILIDEAENLVIFGFQFTALLLDDGLYFGFQGDDFHFRLK
ncbi:hypothetical protein G9A89_012442 [Geosiphon pyriformis]|nr:hypothetical protein G9A89_012442 [Geosiphon pyriformis]